MKTGFEDYHYVGRAMRLLHCSPEDADSIWFWQFLDTSTTACNTVHSEETVKDMLNRYVPQHHGDKTPLQLAAVAIAYHLPTPHLSQNPPDYIRCLEGIIAAIIAAGAGLHEGNHHHTPLLLFLATISGRDHWGVDLHSRPGDICRGLMAFLRILECAGVDLVAYGAEESRQFLMYRSLKNPVPPLLYWHNTSSPMFSNEVFYFSLSYGPTPEDWTVQLDHMVEQYVDEFWQMPGLLDETEVQVIPGAWIDEV